MCTRVYITLLVLYVLNFTTSLTDLLDTDVEHHCMQKCPLQVRTDRSHYELECGFECDSVSKCEEGCKLWKQALESSCQSVCNGTLEPLSSKELYCVMGCNDAVARYFSQLRAKLGTPVAPALVADSLTATSLRLEWKFPEARHVGLTYFVQWRYEELAASWQYCKNQTWGPHDTVIVTNLQPYTKYRFRVALLLSPHSEPIVSAPSVVISTLPAGVPASPPIIVRAVAVDCTHISVSWEPGPFPHGPLLSYVLHITDNHGYSALKDIPAENNFYMYRDLMPARNYTVSISMTNGVGSGPAAQVLVSTPAVPLVKEIQQPVLILSSRHVVIEQGTDMLEVPVVLYQTEKEIRGIAIHIKQHLLFVSDSSRSVRRVSFTNITNGPKTSAILAPPHINFTPLQLSIDWLNNQLYILGEVTHPRQVWQIVRCDLDGRGLQVALAGLRTKPYHVEVDPYNGFLFWVIQGGTSGGLYRLDLSDISNGIKHSAQPEHIAAASNLGAFTVDHTNFRLLCSNQSLNTINSVSLDGKEVVNIRPKIIARKMQKVLSLATANKTFYWTDGNDVFYEEYNPLRESYYHNAYPDLTDRPYLKVIVNLPSSQPMPIPINPPTSLQAIFGPKVVKISWKTPHLLGEQGKGAWQNWSYEISIKDINGNHIRSHKNINITSCTVQNLEEGKEYVIKVAAYTHLGQGPWSSEFRGKTLKLSKSEKYPTVLWSASNGLLQSDATGDNIQTLIPKQIIKDYLITDVAWYNNRIYFVNNKSQIYWYNLNNHEVQQIVNNDFIGSIAIDWIGKKLYWTDPKQHLILRGNFNGTQQEPLPILTVAKELNIDAVEAHLYWSTGHAVECARLNGADKLVYHSGEFFSGRQVMGLTLDMNHKTVYWIIRSSEGSTLFRAPMAATLPPGTNPVAESVSNLQIPDMQGRLCYFNDRLLWLKDERNAIISDLLGKNIAFVNGKELSDLSTVYVMDPTLYLWPNTTNKLVNGIFVIPEPIEKNSITAVGSWNSFNIVWKKCHNVNYGTVFYEIKVDTTLQNGSTKITTVPYIKYWQNVTPFSKLQVTIRAYTYWGSSPLVRVRILSPPSTPSAPDNLRLFVSHNTYINDTQDVSIIFRWDAPLNSNGVIQGYKIRCWYSKDEINRDICENAFAKADEREYQVNHIFQHDTYYFQVKAFTEIGDGEPSQITSINTSIESPVPKLLVSLHDSIFLQDIDLNKSYSLLHGINTPVEIAHILQENKLYWINDVKELLVFDLLNFNRSKIIDINGDAVSLTVDWIERSLYYIQNNKQESSVYKLSLNEADKGIFKSIFIFSMPFNMSRIEVSPFTRKLYWIQKDYDQYHLMQCDTDGTHIQPFFSQQFNENNASNFDFSPCNCPSDPFIERAFTVDHSNSRINPLLIYVDSDLQNIVSADKTGCNCNTITDSDLVEDIFPLQTLKSDFGMLYWTNSNQSLIYSFKKKENTVIKWEQLMAKNLLIYGTHTQPYPAYRCLIPKYTEKLQIHLLHKTSTTLTIILPVVQVDENCKNISIPSTEYSVSYTLYKDDYFIQCDTDCTQVTTFEKQLVIETLKPFTKYIFFLTVSNYYSNLMQKKLATGPTAVFQTSAGAPSKPETIEAVVLNPTLARVSWSPPKQINGESVWYGINWQTEGDINRIKQKGEQIVLSPEVLDQENNLYSELQKLAPNESYSVWVRAYSQTNEAANESDPNSIAFTDSDSTRIITFPEPDNITVINYTSSELYIHLNKYNYAKQYIQYAYLISDDWFNVIFNETESENDSINMKISHLKPKTKYKFRMILHYPNYSEPYVWPSDSRFIFETLGDRPSPPGMPKVQNLKGDVYQVWWEASKDNGAPIETYFLEGLKLIAYRRKRSTNRPPWFDNAPSIDELVENWVPLYNGTDTFWIISGLDEQHKYAFRVSALNSYGWSNTSEESSEFDLSIAAQLAEKQDPMNLIFIALIPVVICIFIIICFCCCKWYCTKNKSKQAVVIPRGPDVELATLRELPRRWIHNTNILYTTNQLASDEITMLPHIRRDQITLMKFLGSGAFGEVFEGKARNINGDDAEINVAIKTLRKGASDVEKCEFLQEAQLMSHFKHKHILQLLGVCLDNDPQFIIMELMQGGDLLTYLRSSRNPMITTPPLMLKELIKMCVDVANGCRYLEEMHFVHRDLACRNCLVSSTDPEMRIVKIGDFGLTRDIYKNDYYRKEGEGLLPVRWMAPESLVDGIFTCQSDVWAFGVLLWEIMTLGQQPYPARNNLEVLHYVKSGGRLGKPTDCPEKLHELMLKCWSYEPERRPTFKYCLSMLTELHNEVNNAEDSNNTQYISTIPNLTGGVFNQAYFQDINLKESATWKTTNEEEIEKEKTPFLKNDITKIPTYLELIYDGSYEDDNDGYEIPRSSIRSIKSDSTKRVAKTASDETVDTTTKHPVNDIKTGNQSKTENHGYINQETGLKEE